MSVSCSTVAGIQLSLSLNSVLLFFFFPPFFPFPVILLHLSQFKLTGGKTLFIFAIWLQVISLKAAFRSSFLSFIVCLTIFWLLLTFAAVSILYWWPRSWIHVTWSFFAFMPSKCCHLIDPVPVCDASKPKRVTKLTETQIQQCKLKCCFIVWGSVSPLLFLFPDGFGVFSADYEQCYWAIIVSNWAAAKYVYFH